MAESDAAALQAAVDQFRTAWAELSKPARVVADLGRAFDAYQRDLKTAFGSTALQALDPGALAHVAHSMAIVASHRMSCRAV
jgi:hypothetical protein